MKLKFPLDDVKIEFAKQKRQVSAPLLDDGFYCLNQSEFSMDVKNVGWFYAASGNFISLFLYPEATKPMVELYLNGSVYGAILHQRKILPLHGSSFIFENQGIMICGESGAGKSSITASFCKNGAKFLTDDVSPVVFKDEKPYIKPLSDRIKLWEDSLSQLKIKDSNLEKIRHDFPKYYYSMQSIDDQYPLDFIFIVEKHDSKSIKISEISGWHKFQELRNEIYRWNYLQAMKQTEVSYLKSIINMSNYAKIIKVCRPFSIDIESMTAFLKNQIIDLKKQKRPN